ncbi:MAG: transcriptional regulator, partial [Candidatus Paceibacterales bacterium]
ELVKQESQGREIYYQLEINKMKEIDKWLEQFRKIWEKRFDQLDKLLSTIKKSK